MPTSHTPPALTLPAGMRATKAVQAMLALLPDQPAGGWTEALLEVALGEQGIAVNRVTVYRALDRLVQAGVLQRSVDTQRRSRYFVVAVMSAPQTVPHLECTACHQQIKLGEGSAAVESALQALRQALSHSAGVANPSLAITVQGECPQCAEPSAGHPSVS